VASGLQLEQKQAWMRERQSSAGSAAVSQSPTSSHFAERHYTVAELSELWSLSPDVVRRLFEREPGVFVIGDQGTRSKRRYTTLRIPQSVVERVHRRLCNPELTGLRARE
jgi:hypothetical protein